MTLIIGHDHKKVRPLIYLPENERSQAKLEKNGKKKLHFAVSLPT
jgi:hypothetical protein